LFTPVRVLLNPMQRLPTKSLIWMMSLTSRRRKPDNAIFSSQETKNFGA